MISIVVDNYGRSYNLGLLLQAFDRYKFEEDEVEMVIVDDNSPEPFESYLGLALEQIQPRFSVRAFQTNDETWTNPGITANIGVKQSRGEIIILTHSDVIPLNPYTLRETWKYHQEHDWAHLSSTLLCTQHEWLAKETFPVVGGELSLPGSSMPRKLFDKIGGFDERFRVYGHEDTDILWRIYYGQEALGITHGHHKELFYLHLTPAHVLERPPTPPDNEEPLMDTQRKRQWVANEGKEWGVCPGLEQIDEW